MNFWGTQTFRPIATQDPGSYVDNTETLHAPSYSYTMSTLLLLPGTPTLSSFPSNVSGESSLVITEDPIPPASLFFDPFQNHTSSCLPIVYLTFESF